MDSTIRDQAYRFFVQEARDFLHTIETGLLHLREDSSVGTVHAMMRAAHSIKGGAASVDLPAIQSIAHRLEDIFRALYRQDKEPISVELEELLLQAFDCLRLPLMQEIERGSHDREKALAKAEEVFTVVEAYLGDSLTGDVELPTAQELGFDIVQTVFTSDVPQGIARLQEVLADPNCTQVAGEIRAQAEVFVGIGELLNLSGFTQIAQTVIQALDHYPDRAAEIGALAVANFIQAQTLVLNGDRTSGGTPSPQMLTLAGASSLTIAEPAEPTIVPEPEPVTDVKETPLPSAMTEVVRVDLSRLERLNNQLGELVTQENTSLLQTERMADAVLNLQRCFDRFQTLTAAVRQWLDNSQKQQVRQNRGAQLEDFDSLQLDSYGYFYVRMLEVLEEMGQMQETMRDMQVITQQAEQNQRRKQQTIKQMRDNLLRARMLPLNEVLQRFPRMVRDLSVRYGKQVKLKISGGNTLVDKAVLEKLYDPLVHLVRNAFDHGTEPPAVRVQKGKNPTATIEISAYHRGNQTYIQVKDDGQGIQIDRVKETAIKRNLLAPAQAEQLPPEQVYALLFEPAFSTATEVSELSGRGVGLATVRQQVQSLKGAIDISSIPDQGTTFSIRLPLTLTVTKLLVFSIDKHLMAIPVDSLEGIFSASITDIQVIQGRQYYLYEEELIPLYPISAFPRRYPIPANTDRPFSPMAMPEETEIPLLVISGGMALEIDHIITEQELTIKPFGKLITPPPYLYGCTILGDGTLVPVIDGVGLVQNWQSQAQHTSPAILDMESGNISFNQLTVLVIDDSLTARETLSLTLKKYGYRVIQAGDGQEALSKLKQEKEIKVIFCDIEMPKMNGFEFLNQYRQDYPNSDRAIIMLTTRSSDKHRSLAKMLGASAYLTKPYIEQELVDTIQRVMSVPV